MTQEQARILIVDDEEAIRFFLSEELDQAGYTVFTAASGEEALFQLQKESVDLVLLDLQMTGISGLQVMEALEQHPLRPAIIILTAHASLDSAIDAMRMGGCDYLRKPSRTETLLASVEKALAKRRETLQRQEMLHLIEETARRLRTAPTPGFALARPAPAPPVPELTSRPRFIEGRGLLLDLEQESTSKNGRPLSLTQSEFQLLACLMEQIGEPVSYRELASALHGHEGGQWEEEEARQALSTHLWRLRRKLGDGPDDQPYLANVRGRGYKFISSK